MSDRGTRLIDRLELPGGLRTLDAASLRQVASELRDQIIETVSCNGGHLGASLGAVELALALHAELDTPKDAIIWDVGHQSYAHKLLTGRLESFGSIRQYGGLSGFPSRAESPYDAYGTGHSSTSISAAVGIAEARRRVVAEATPDGGEQVPAASAPGRVVAVIGDGALTGY